MQRVRKSTSFLLLQKVWGKLYDTYDARDANERATYGIVHEVFAPDVNVSTNTSDTLHPPRLERRFSGPDVVPDLDWATKGQGHFQTLGLADTPR